jgi:hypothetical protein
MVSWGGNRAISGFAGLLVVGGKWLYLTWRLVTPFLVVVNLVMLSMHKTQASPPVPRGTHS